MLSQDWWGRFKSHSLSWGGPHGSPIAEYSVGQSETISLFERQSRWLKKYQETRLLFYYHEENLNELRPKVVVQQLFWRDRQLYEIIYYILWSPLPFAFDNNSIAQFFTGILTYTWKLGSSTMIIMYFIGNRHPVYQWKHLRDSHSK